MDDECLSGGQPGPATMSIDRIRVSHHPVLGPLTHRDDQYVATEGAEALAVATEWSAYRNPDFVRVAKLIRGKHVFDGRNVLSPEAVVNAGLYYLGMGLPAFR